MFFDPQRTGEEGMSIIIRAPEIKDVDKVVRVHLKQFEDKLSQDFPWARFDPGPFIGFLIA